MIEVLLFASSSPDFPARIEAPVSEIIVTGERVARSRRETASSVWVADAQTIDAGPAPDRIDQLLQMVPNVQLGSGGEGPTIRGQDSTGVVRDLPAFLGGSRPRSTIEIDGRPATYYELAFGLTSVWDVSQVEVFRSPQTTTQGRNSIGGAIFVETNAPTDNWEGRGRLIVGDASTHQASVVLSGPIAGDQLAVRISGDVRRSRTSSRITNAAVDIDPNRDTSELLRVKLRARPDPVPGLSLDLTYAHGRSQMPQFEGIEPPYQRRRNPNATYGIFRIDVDSLTVRAAYQPASALGARFTTSVGDARMRRFAPKGLGEALISSKDFSVEPVAHWQPSPMLRVTTGLHYLRSELDQTIDVSAQQFGTGAFVDRQWSFGLFGEARLQIPGGPNLGVGLRYQRDDQRRKGAMTGGVAQLPVDYDESFDKWLPKLSLAYDLSPNLRIGALVQRAYNPGGMTINTSRFRVDTFRAETLWDYELYARFRSAGGRLHLSANAFRHDMRDAQRTQTIAFPLPNGQIAFAAEVENAPRAWTVGLEMEAEWRPSPKLGIRGGIGILDSKVTETIDPADPMRGRRFQRSPHLTASASLDWSPLEPLRVSLQVRANSAYFSDDVETAERRVAGSSTADAKASWRTGNVTLFGYARNLFDEFHLTYLFPLPNRLATAGDPRELGLGIEARF